ncbi:nucleoporin-interacting protein NIC96 [Stereum hirsutum FP-91666 SS1]|uniref:nucleoporin-interacting protein NIC96 n=1 Tax=Stereum hirsutum (strain FP-91666) TaxID=721885 RepID=UPI000440AF17|nr:nucleoporin-interacting protein NIC96 [Stereum hirsutum FP-91666 SS1]EIM91909.1 nucleoporin-interacting protein NIC96 [Stereum hirsutum FP-91666 SS1]
MAADSLASLLTSSKALTSHLSRPDLPQLNLSLDQIEAQSRRLVSRQPGAATDSGRANYLLAQAHVDAPALANAITQLNTSTTFSPLRPLQDTDIASYLRHAHEQNIISTIEEARRETQEDFYRVLEDRSRQDWETRKKRVFEELGGRVGGDNPAVAQYRKSHSGKSAFAMSTGPSPSLQMQSKMMAYDRPITELNQARLRGVSYPIIHALLHSSLALHPDRTNPMSQLFHLLSKITSEPPSIPPLSHSSAHILNAPLFERKHARAYLNDPSSRDALDLRRQIAKGSREALEEQYFDVLERTVHSRPTEARLGGDPSVSNKVRAFLLVRFYRGGEWQERIELVAGQPLWAKLFYLVRTGYGDEALREAVQHQAAIEHREDSFVMHFRTWIESPDRRLPKPHRDHIQSIYNAHLLHSSTVDPFKLALYKLMGRLDPSRRSVPLVTATTEDWLWFQLSMLDEDEEGSGLNSLGEVLMGYGERYFEGGGASAGAEGQAQAKGRTGLWASVLLMTGQFERAVAALWDHPETEIEAVHMAIALSYHGLLRVPSRTDTAELTLSFLPNGQVALNLPTLIWRYVRQFVKMDGKEALQYVYTVTLNADQPGVGEEQVEQAWEMVRRIITLANAGPAWDELVGGFRTDGNKFSGVIEHFAPLLKLPSAESFNAQILIPAAQHSSSSDRPLEAIKLYNLAGDYDTVVACLAQALGASIGQPNAGGERGKAVEGTAREIVRHYVRMNRGAGQCREAVEKLLKIREAMGYKEEGRVDLALELLESTEIVTLDGDVGKINKKADEFKNQHESLQRNIEMFLPLVMDCVVSVYRKIKTSNAPDSARQATLATLRKKSKSVIMFAGFLKYRLSPDVYNYLARLDVEVSL